MSNFYESIATLQEAANNWAEYLSENDREEEIEPIDEANDTIDKVKKFLRDYT
jgi:hypothetical protein